MALPIPRTLAGYKTREFSPEYLEVRRELTKLGLRRCLDCGELLNVSEFYVSRRALVSSSCKACTVQRTLRNRLLRKIA